jgi:CheY-like chemotaxis protein
VAVRLPSSPLTVRGDAVRLTQVLDNLLVNAARYTDEGGRIDVVLESDPQHRQAALLRVRDNGIGIPAPMLEQVFDLFTQANPSFARTQGGLGIGLALVRGLVHLRGGTVRAFSEGAGRGAEFVVQLPLARVDVQLPVEEAEGAPHQAADVELRLLIVDDNVDSAEGLAQWLHTMGHRVQVCHAGDSGLKCALAQPPDAVLLDIGLPGLSGIEVAERLRAEPSFDRIPLIAMTGFGGAADRHRAKEAGFDHYLVKPIDYCELGSILAGKRHPAAGATSAAKPARLEEVRHRAA